MAPVRTSLGNSPRTGTMSPSGRATAYRGFSPGVSAGTTSNLPCTDTDAPDAASAGVIVPGAATAAVSTLTVSSPRRMELSMATPTSVIPTG